MVLFAEIISLNLYSVLSYNASKTVVMSLWYVNRNYPAVTLLAHIENDSALKTSKDYYPFEFTHKLLVSFHWSWSWDLQISHLVPHQGCPSHFWFHCSCSISVTSSNFYLNAVLFGVIVFMRLSWIKIFILIMIRAN